LPEGPRLVRGSSPFAMSSPCDPPRLLFLRPPAKCVWRSPPRTPKSNKRCIKRNPRTIHSMTVTLPNATMQPRCQSEIDASVARIVLADLLLPATAECPIRQNHGQKFVWVAPVPVRRRRVLVGIQWFEARIDSASSEVPSNRLVKSAFATSFAEVRHFH
jgi:hypothetical protein